MAENDDKKIWATYAKGVKLFKPPRESAPLGRPKRAAAPPPLSKEIESRKTAPSTRIDIQAPLERNLERRLRQGTIVPEARLDLHGMREAEAHQALMNFIGRQEKAGRRYLLVITGKGRGGQGVLRARLKNWLIASSYVERILTLRQAAIRHGGCGAFYVVLRKRKNGHA